MLSGCSEEWTKPSVHMRVLVWASELELAPVGGDNSSSSSPNVNFGAVRKAIGPTLLQWKKPDKLVCLQSGSLFSFAENVTVDMINIVTVR